MRIKLADEIRVGALVGTIESISIGVVEGDPAGELGPNIDEYDTDLGYQGSVTYTTPAGQTKWAYFAQIDEVL